MPQRYCAIVQLLELEVSFLGLPVPLLPAGLSGLRCLGLVLLNLLLVRQQQLLEVDPTLEVELDEGLAQFDNLNINPGPSSRHPQSS